ncbi:hypothetical protein RFI_04787 [Reticulomyxa filosa]|uniref:Uncharacterized protein n=1 Tax=Reticulomyxa filosa TaxID=46433 RepID=X6P195_RETFI|nr:hypothetical protein RFI_04787 [Reticulomyxa filosa]|eukprot:ETO32330.1 hypothetical protein RFI_04787 [Reticulomyxa filosa]
MFWLVYVSGGVLGNLAVVWKYYYHYDKSPDKVQALSKNNKPKMLEYNWCDSWTQKLIQKKRDYNNRINDWLHKLINDDKAFVGCSSCIYVINQNRILYIMIYTCANFVMFFVAKKKKKRDIMSLFPVVFATCFLDMFASYMNYKRPQLEVIAAMRDLNRTNKMEHVLQDTTDRIAHWKIRNSNAVLGILILGIKEDKKFSEGFQQPSKLIKKESKAQIMTPILICVFLVGKVQVKVTTECFFLFKRTLTCNWMLDKNICKLFEISYFQYFLTICERLTSFAVMKY